MSQRLEAWIRLFHYLDSEQITLREFMYSLNTNWNPYIDFDQKFIDYLLFYYDVK